MSWGAEGFDFGAVELPRPLPLEKSMPVGYGGGDFMEPDDGKLRPLKASARPPKESCWLAGGDDRPPKEDRWLCEGCTGGEAGEGFGAEAYSESIDCFRSGLEVLLEPSGLEPALDGLSVDCGLPKKSKPSNESPGRVGLATAGAAVVLFTGFDLETSVVLGLAGTTGVSSPNRSMLGAACRNGGGC